MKDVQAPSETTTRQIIHLFKNNLFTWFSFRECYWGCRQASRIQILISHIILPVKSPRGVIEEWNCNCCIGGWDPGSAQKMFRYFVLFSTLPHWLCCGTLRYPTDLLRFQFLLRKSFGSGSSSGSGSNSGPRLIKHVFQQQNSFYKSWLFDARAALFPRKLAPYLRFFDFCITYRTTFWILVEIRFRNRNLNELPYGSGSVQLRFHSTAYRYFKLNSHIDYTLFNFNWGSIAKTITN